VDVALKQSKTGNEPARSPVGLGSLWNPVSAHLRALLILYVAVSLLHVRYGLILNMLLRIVHDDVRLLPSGMTRLSLPRDTVSFHHGIGFSHCGIAYQSGDVAVAIGRRTVPCWSGLLSGFLISS